MSRHPIPKEALDDRLGFRSRVITDWTSLTEPSDAGAAYAAGFFDGEGCVSISRTQRKDCNGPTYCLAVIVGQINVEPLLFLQNRWGGSISHRIRPPPYSNVFDWRTQADSAASFLRSLLPYLILKQERAKLAINFQALKGGQGKYRGDSNRPVLFEEFYGEMRAMNGNAPNPWRKN